MGSRKVFAIRRADLATRKRLSSAIEEDSSDEEGDETADITESVKAINTKLDALFKMDRTMSIPIALRRLIMDTFQCHICREPIKPPAIFTKCCRYILGCQSCVDTWYSGGERLDKPCPRCRAERGYAETCLLRGMDEFLSEFASIADPEENQEE